MDYEGKSETREGTVGAANGWAVDGCWGLCLGVGAVTLWRDG